MFCMWIAFSIDIQSTLINKRPTYIRATFEILQTAENTSEFYLLSKYTFFRNRRKKNETEKIKLKKKHTHTRAADKRM